jgi:hypothetical protein
MLVVNDELDGDYLKQTEYPQFFISQIRRIALDPVKPRDILTLTAFAIFP